MDKHPILAAAITCAALWYSPAVAVTLDGRIDPAEWRDATRITEFHQVQPLTGAVGTLHTEAWVLATPEGLAVAFRNAQPPGVPRTLQKVRRDFDAQVDRVSVMVDFDADGRTGYGFTVASTGGVADVVVTDENQFQPDWDGNWQRAVSADAESWSVEILIPWYIASMRDGREGVRDVALYLDRVIGSTGERLAWPSASFERPRFLSEFQRIRIPQYEKPLLAASPYLSGLYDIVGARRDFDAGMDVLWKPNGQFQLTATISPDFGQIESDDLVVNFGATETFLSDKRPFFTENQGLFAFTTPSDDSQLLYTRRVGSATGDGEKAADILGAVKINGSFGSAKYGVFLADEAGDMGRTFGALRLVRDFHRQNVGAMVTRVVHAHPGREAVVFGADHNWRSSSRMSIETRLIGSQIEQDGRTSRGLGGTVWMNYEMDAGWRQQWLAMHFDDRLQLNDFGYLARNSVNYASWQLMRRFTALPVESRYASRDWSFRISGTDNDRGEVLQRQLRISRQSRLRDGSFEYAQISINSAGMDDLLARGRAPLRLPPNASLHLEYERPRNGNLAWNLAGNLSTGGLAGNDKVGFDVEWVPTYFFTDAFSAYAGVHYERIPDWLVWQSENLVGSFDESMLRVSAGLDWSIDDRQELRVKLQALALGAEWNASYRLDGEGHAVESTDPIGDFSLRKLGFQVRYRYELGPLSHLFLVYGRGGIEQSFDSDDIGQSLRESVDLRDDEQVLVKLSYRFEI